MYLFIVRRLATLTLVSQFEGSGKQAVRATPRRRRRPNHDLEGWNGMEAVSAMSACLLFPLARSASVPPPSLPRSCFLLRFLENDPTSVRRGDVPEIVTAASITFPPSRRSLRSTCAQAPKMHPNSFSFPSYRGRALPFLPLFTFKLCQAP